MLLKALRNIIVGGGVLKGLDKKYLHRDMATYVRLVTAWKTVFPITEVGRVDPLFVLVTFVFYAEQVK